MLKDDYKCMTLCQLKKAKSLTEADTLLALLSPVPSRSWRWGAWDGFHNLPQSTSGLISQHEEGKKARGVQIDYEKGFKYGVALAMESMEMKR